MTNKKVIQKLVTFESKKRDFNEVTKELVDGWQIASIMPHKNSFICVLEKNIGDFGNENDQQIPIENIVSLVTQRKRRITEEV